MVWQWHGSDTVSGGVMVVVWMILARCWYYNGIGMVMVCNGTVVVLVWKRHGHDMVHSLAMVRLVSNVEVEE